ncbi:MAG: nucleotidyltransferase family protein [Armatimonadetes bacterium]|nr:nucleotidyltransferase family protein [Armatimonadota bacterium]
MNIEGIVLAAGFSSRTGKFKMEMLLAGKTLIERSVESLDKVCSKIIVVAGYKSERIKEILKSYEKVEVVFNKEFEKGMFSSVKVGISQIKTEKFFLLPGDIPFVKEKVFRKLLSKQGDIVIPVFQSRKGHPVLINSSLIIEILDESEDSNLKLFIDKKGFTTVEVQDEAILIDIDTEEDYLNYSPSVKCCFEL